MKLLYDIDSSITYNIIPEHKQFRIELLHKGEYFNNFVVNSKGEYYMSFKNEETFDKTTSKEIYNYVNCIVQPQKVMVTQEIPKPQLDIIKKALNFYNQSIENILDNGEDKQYLLFDLITLNALMNYNIKVELSKEDLDKFTHTEGIDFPNYIK